MTPEEEIDFKRMRRERDMAVMMEKIRQGPAPDADTKKANRIMVVIMVVMGVAVAAGTAAFILLMMLPWIIAAKIIEALGHLTGG